MPTWRSQQADTYAVVEPAAHGLLSPFPRKTLRTEQQTAEK